MPTIAPFQAAQTPAQRPAEAPADPDLAGIVDAWPTLPEAVRSALLLLVRSATAER